MRRKERINTKNRHSHPSSKVEAASIFHLEFPCPIAQQQGPGSRAAATRGGDKNVSVILTGLAPEEETGV